MKLNQTGFTVEIIRTCCHSVWEISKVKRQRRMKHCLDKCVCDEKEFDLNFFLLTCKVVLVISGDENWQICSQLCHGHFSMSWLVHSCFSPKQKFHPWKNSQLAFCCSCHSLCVQHLNHLFDWLSTEKFGTTLWKSASFMQFGIFLAADKFCTTGNSEKSMNWALRGLSLSQNQLGNWTPKDSEILNNACVVRMILLRRTSQI